MWSDASTVLVDADRLHQGRSQAVCDAGAVLDVVSGEKATSSTNYHRCNTRRAAASRSSVSLASSSKSRAHAFSCSAIAGTTVIFLQLAAAARTLT